MISPATASLYVHLPWCVKKCPYCDFNSHALRSSLDEDSYIKALLNDLAVEVRRFETRPAIESVFLGGGTPSLFSGKSIDHLLCGINALVDINETTEITLEANPGTADAQRFEAYRQAGVNRLSIGVQSFNDYHLSILGRIHGKDQALRAVDMAVKAGFLNFNLDLMYCLPQQNPEQASEDIALAIALSPAHISAYQLTLEPNTFFAFRPPELPDDETGWQIQQAYQDALKAANYDHYEISAFGKPDRKCLHNLNYWRFGDYLGIGAGAHGKLTLNSTIYRTIKPKHPDQYLKTFRYQPAQNTALVKAVDKADLPLEYMMNVLRLKSGFSLTHLENATGLDRSDVMPEIKQAVSRGLLIKTSSVFRPSEKGTLFLDDLLQIFIPNSHKEVA